MNNMYKMPYLQLNDLDNNDNNSKIFTYLKNPLIVFFIFLILNTSICVTSIDNVFFLCNNSLASIINLIIRSLLAALLFLIISSLSQNI